MKYADRMKEHTDLVAIPTRHAKVTVLALQQYEDRIRAGAGFDPGVWAALREAAQMRRVLEVGIEVARHA